MDIVGERQLPAPRQTVWEALNDPQLLKRCIAGCDSFEAAGDNVYNSVVAVKIGPVSAKFNAQITLQDLNPPNAYTIQFDGKGGMAGFGKGNAQVSLEDKDGGTLLKYVAKAQVGGKLAQLGSRLIDAATVKLTDEFFQAFEKEVGAQVAANTFMSASLADGKLSASGEQAVPANISSMSVHSESRRDSEKGGSLRWWIIGGVIALIAAWLLKR